MARREYTHYTCDYCAKETVDKKDGMLNGWIAISRGTSSFHKGEPLSITYMVEGWDSYEPQPNTKQMWIMNNLSFCCKECLLLYMLKHLGLTEELPKDVNVKLNEPKPTVVKKSRFDNIDTE